MRPRPSLDPDFLALQEMLDSALWLVFGLTGALATAIAWGWWRGRRRLS